MLRNTVVFSAPDKLLLLKNAKKLPEHSLNNLITVNSGNFARVLLSRNFAYAKFRETKSSRNGEITLSFISIAKACTSRAFQCYSRK